MQFWLYPNVLNYMSFLILLFIRDVEPRAFVVESKGRSIRILERNVVNEVVQGNHFFKDVNC